ncbi:MAG: DNA polymerase III subunit beta [Candidatus Paceibacterota bacterium]
MKVSCSRERLLDILYKTERATGKNLSLTVLSCIYIEAKKNSLSFRATNLDLGVEITIPAKVEQEGNVAVVGSLLSQVVSSSAHTDSITLEVKENNIEIKTNTSVTTLTTQNHDDFPTIPYLSEGFSSFVIPASNVLEGIKAVNFCSSNTTIKPELSSVYIYSDSNELVFVATDSFRLAEKKLKTKIKEDIKILIPNKNAIELTRFLTGVNEDVEVRYTENQISFLYKNYYFTSRIINGTFPDYKQIIPKEFVTTVRMLRQDFLDALKKASIFSGKFNQIKISIASETNTLTIATNQTELGAHTDSLKAEVTGEDFEIHFNEKYIADALQYITTDSIELHFAGKGKPLIVKPSPPGSFLYLVMPMNK